MLGWRSNRLLRARPCPTKEALESMKLASLRSFAGPPTSLQGGTRDLIGGARACHLCVLECVCFAGARARITCACVCVHAGCVCLLVHSLAICALGHFGAQIGNLFKHVPLKAWNATWWSVYARLTTTRKCFRDSSSTLPGQAVRLKGSLLARIASQHVRSPCVYDRLCHVDLFRASMIRFLLVAFASRAYAHGAGIARAFRRARRG